MEKKDFYFLGKILKTSGYSGNLMFFFDVDDIAPYKNLDAVFIEISEEMIPFVIEKLTFHSNKTANVKLEDVTDEQAASALIGNELYLPLSFLPPLSGNKFYFHEITGFTVIDNIAGPVGTIESVYESTNQPLLIIKKNGKEILIPISDDIIKKVDRKNKTIEIEAPEGLIDIYL